MPIRLVRRRLRPRSVFFLVSHASSFAASLEVAELPPSLRNLVDRPGFSFADFPQGPPAAPRLSAKGRDELLTFIRHIHAQLREIELGLTNEQAFAGLQ